MFILWHESANAEYKAAFDYEVENLKRLELMVPNKNYIYCVMLLDELKIEGA